MISVVVPVYKVEPYLRCCLDSIVSQTYKDLEIILVDDGSPDNCGAICDEYAAKDSRIVVIHKANGGLSAARNDGIARATGDWVAFVDSDDWCEPDYYETILKEAGEIAPDVIVAGGFYKEGPKKCKKVRYVNKAQLYEDKEHIDELMAQVDTYGMPWDKLYKSSFLKGNELRFDVSIRAFEDFLFNFQVFDKAESVFLCPVMGYHYRQVATSIAKGFNPDKPEINYAFISRIHKYAAEQGVSDKVKSGINATALCAVSVAIFCYFFHPANTKKRSENYKELFEMIDKPYFHEAIYSRSNEYFTKKQVVLKYALRTRWGGASGTLQGKGKPQIKVGMNMPLCAHR